MIYDIDSVNTVNIRKVRGDSWAMTGQYLVNGVAASQTGFVWFVTVKNTGDNLSNDSEALVSYSVAAATSATETALTPDISGLAVGNYHYDIQIKTNSGAILTPQIGTLTIHQDETSWFADAVDDL